MSMPVTSEKPTPNGTKGVYYQPIPALSPEEEDQIVNTRITNDERPLKRVIKKFHQYANVVNTPLVPLVPSSGATNAEDAREAFLVELASFQLLLQKNAMICEAEARQVEEYQKEKQRIGDYYLLLAKGHFIVNGSTDLEHNTLRGQIEQLKTALEEAQISRRQKMEYDAVAEKVNTLPTREELAQTIEALESDMLAVRDEHETQVRSIQSQKIALDSIVSELGSLRFSGGDSTVSALPSRRGTPALEGARDSEGAEDLDLVQAIPESPDKEDGEEGEEKAPESEVDGDIEMGEVEEDVKNSRTRKREDLEEGEATDAESSDLSEI
ncbi:hypothetical protein D9757_002655 [Collybiopsis confluens]|uniref:Uncharacterized protein n=1 Tax=Collybiopsis confluens TaxID=2823264 RepID=A0A8H5HW94_9AGAR|nr:hypothetical protein D9757_002655 [Collybiopsis confluens]